MGKVARENGNGTYSTTTYDAVTGDSVYVSKLKDFFLTQQRNYGVNYWKLDGFATQQPQASTNGRYITGGKMATTTLPSIGSVGIAPSLPCMPMPIAATKTCGLILPATSIHRLGFCNGATPYGFKIHAICGTKL